MPPRLAPCPASPNCVSSEATDPNHFVDPLPVVGNGPATLRLLRSTIIEATPRTRIVAASDTAIDAEYRSWLFRVRRRRRPAQRSGGGGDPGALGVPHGYYDFAVNRKRVEALRQALARQMQSKR